MSFRQALPFCIRPLAIAAFIAGLLSCDSLPLTNGDEPPTAALTVACVELNCEFDASASSDPDGSITELAWEFGDAQSGAGVAVSHTYAAAGDYAVILTVTDDDGLTDQAQELVTVSVGTGPPPPPPPSGSCEPAEGDTCWYVDAAAASDGAGTIDDPFRLPQTAIDRAEPGDFIYLSGTFTEEHATGRTSGGGIDLFDRTSGVDGAPDAFITISSAPGQTAVIQGMNDNIVIPVSRDYWVVHGLRVIRGMIIVAWSFVQGVHDVWVTGNEVSGAVFPEGNSGLIRVHGAGPGADSPWNVFIHDNVVHDAAGEGLTWETDLDTEHHSCIMIQHATGLVEVVGNEAYHCPSFFYFKFNGPGPTLIKENYLHDVRKMGEIRPAQNTFEGNVIAGLIDPRGGWALREESTDNVFINNTWVLDQMEVLQWSGPLAGHVFRDNVVFTRDKYHKWTLSASGDWSASDIDGNCVIGPSDLLALAPDGNDSGNRTWDEYVAEFGHDADGVYIVETDQSAVFDADYSLLGEAATQCVGKGAR